MPGFLDWDFHGSQPPTTLVDNGKRGKQKRRAANKRARAQRRRNR